MINKNKHTIRDLIIIFLLSLTPLLWFRDGMVMVGHDNVAPLDPPRFFENRLSTWSDQFFGQSQALIMGTIPIHAVDALPSYLGFSLQTGQKIVSVLWFFLIGLSAYILGMVLLPRNSLFQLTASTLYQFNFFILQGWWIVEKSKFSAYIALPLIMSILVRVHQGSLSAIVGAVLTSIVVFLFNAGGMFGIPLYGGIIITVFSTLLFFVFTHIRTRQYKRIKNLFAYVFFSFVLSIGINGYYILPAVLKLLNQFQEGISQIGGASGVVSWASEISANASFLNLMRLQGIPDWYDNFEHPYAGIFLNNPWFIVMSFIWPILIFISFLRAKKHLNSHVLLFVFVYLIGLFFAAGTHPPFGIVYQWLIEHVPGFVVFRTPYYKFAPALFLSSAFLIAFFVNSFSAWKRRIIFFLLFFLVLFYHFPFFSGDFFEWRKGFSTRLNVPQYVFDFANWLHEEKNDNKRILLLPPNSPDLEYSLYRWGYLSFAAVPTLFGNIPVVTNNDKLNSFERTLTMGLYQAILNNDSDRIRKLSSILRIGYVVIQNDSYPDVKSSWTISPEPYRKAIISNALYSPIRQFGLWELFELKTAIDPLFVIHNNTVSFAGAATDIDNALDHFNESLNFVIKDDQTHKKLLSSNLIASEIIVPSCINCPKRSKPLIQFPVRNILPGSPLYPFVLMNEERAKPQDGKSRIYHELGISLKRVSEISEIITAQKVLKGEVIDRYQMTLDSIKKNFSTITNQKDKIEISTDVLHYLRSQRTYLRPAISNYLSIGMQTVMVGKMFLVISEMENYFAPYAAPIEESTSRWYQFTTTKNNSFELYYRTGIDEQVNSTFSYETRIDGGASKKTEIKQASQNRWLPLGTYPLDSGYHTVVVTSPVLPKISYELEPMSTEFSERNNNCFGTYIRPVENSKVYRIITRFFNNFSDNLFLYIWEGNQDRRSLVSAAKLSSGPISENREDFVEPSSGINTIFVALCAPNLTQDIAREQFSIDSSETSYPSVLLKSKIDREMITSEIEWKKENQTRYALTIPEIKKPQLVVFSQRYDPWWKLDGYDTTHIQANGYANGWIIGPSPKQTIHLEYTGQKYFYWGIFLSFVTMFFNIIFLFMRKKQK